MFRNFQGRDRLESKRSDGECFAAAVDGDSIISRRHVVEVSIE